MLFSILRYTGASVGLIGTVECRLNDEILTVGRENELANMTTPDPEELYAILSEMVGDGCEYAVMEVTSHALALRKTDPIDFEVAVFTNLTEDHLDLHQNMDVIWACFCLYDLYPFPLA